MKKTKRNFKKKCVKDKLRIAGKRLRELGRKWRPGLMARLTT